MYRDSPNLGIILSSDKNLVMYHNCFFFSLFLPHCQTQILDFISILSILSVDRWVHLTEEQSIRIHNNKHTSAETNTKEKHTEKDREKGYVWNKIDYSGNAFCILHRIFCILPGFFVCLFF